MKKIKRIEVVSLEDLPNAKVLQSIANLWKRKESGKMKYEGKSFKFSYIGKNGELDQKSFQGMVFSKKEFNDWFSETYVLPVKIRYQDGTWEYGLKWQEDKDIVYQRNRKLVPLFVKCGYVNEHIGEIEDSVETGSDPDSRVPAWILDLLPRYNEKIRDMMANGGFPCKEVQGVPIEDWKLVKNVVDTSYVSSSTKYMEMELKNRKIKAAIGLTFRRRSIPWINVIPSKSKVNICVNEFELSNCHLENIAVTIYSYLKSIYEDIHSQRKVYGIIPISDLMVVTMSDFTRDDEHPAGHWVDVEVWNNIDQTINGNV